MKPHEELLKEHEKLLKEFVSSWKENENKDIEMKPEYNPLNTIVAVSLLIFMMICIFFCLIIFF